MRRNKKKLIAGFLCLFFGLTTTLHLVAPPQDDSKKGSPNGWAQSEEGDRERDDFLILGIPKDWQGIGAGKTRLLHDDWLAVHGTPYAPREQGKAPSCVGQAVAAGVDFLAAVEIANGQPERAPPARASAATIYGYSRQEIGELGTFAGGGSHTLWAVQAIQKYGVIAEMQYGLVGVDLRQADPARCIKYGMDGVPDSLDFVARLHPVRDYISIDSYEELRDALVMGCPVVIGSSQGFGDGVRTRDSEGFLVPPKSRRWWRNKGSVWNHSMVVIGVSDAGRPGAMFLNSWGEDWVNGPNRFPDAPKGCFWADAEIVNKMVKQGDAFAIRGFKGYAKYNIWGPR